MSAHRFARGEPERGPSGREPPAELDAVLHCDPPIDRVDAAAFAGRSLASALHQTLIAAGVGCTRLAVHAVTANGEELTRVWRCAEPLTEDATADRVRWQLDGWLNTRIVVDRPTAPVVLLRLHPVEVVSAGALQLPLWGGSAKRTGCGPVERWYGCRACSVRRRCRCRCFRRSRAGRAHHVDAAGRRAGAARRPGSTVARSTAGAVADGAAR